MTGNVAKVGLAVVLAGLAGCGSPCAAICGRMADYAKECSLPVTDAELSSCRDRMSQDLTADDRTACREFGDPEVIRAQWSCDDLSAYWSPGT